MTENVKKLAAEYKADPNCRADRWISDLVKSGECTQEEATQFLLEVGHTRFYIKKTPARGNLFLYEVIVSLGGNGIKIGQRKSHREYVAAAVQHTGIRYSVQSWIGREDLITKNIFIRNGCHVARLVEEPKEYEK